MVGEYFHSMDAKGRLFVPARLREALGDRFYVTKGLDGCLFAYAVPEWEALERRLAALPLSRARDLQRFFLSGAALCECDAQGRILLPGNLRTYAGLTREVCFAGVSDRAEIWDAARWNEYNAALAQDPARVAAAMEELEF